MKLCIEHRGHIVCEADGDKRVHLVYQPPYEKGDAILFENEVEGFYRIRLEDTLEPAIVFVKKGTARYEIPFGKLRAGYSPRAFIGKRHFIEVRTCGEEAEQVRNIAFNPFDTEGYESCKNGIYPHAFTNVRYENTWKNRIFPDKGLFAPRNVIDGICASESHRLYPYHSFGTNQDPNARLTIEFGAPVKVEEIRLTLRSELPHDSYWTSGQLCLHNMKTDIWEEMSVSFEQHGKEQVISVDRNEIDRIAFSRLVNGGTGFAALSDLKVLGKYEV